MRQSAKESETISRDATGRPMNARLKRMELGEGVFYERQLGTLAGLLELPVRQRLLLEERLDTKKSKNSETFVHVSTTKQGRGFKSYGRKLLRRKRSREGYVGD